MRSLLLVLLLSSSAFGQLVVKDHYEPFEPIIAGCDCIVPRNGEVQFMWRVDAQSLSAQSEASDKRLYIWAPPGSHWIEALVLTKTFKDIQVFVPDPSAPNDPSKAKLQTIHVVDSFDVQRYDKTYLVGVAPPTPPTPPTPPDPNPTPTPPVPPTPVPSDDFSKNALAWIKAIPAASYNKAKMLAIADNYAAVAAQAVATTGYDLTAFVSQTKTLNQRTLTPDDIAAWSGPFFNPLATYQSKLFADRKLDVKDTAGIATLWRDTANAIRKAVGTNAIHQEIDTTAIISDLKDVILAARSDTYLNRFLWYWVGGIGKEPPFDPNYWLVADYVRLIMRTHPESYRYWFCENL